MREWSLVGFTLLAQLAVGLFWALLLAGWAAGGGIVPGAGLLLVGPLLLAAAAVSVLHLGSPLGAWRALSNQRGSWLSREILFLALFGGGWALSVWLLRTGPADGLRHVVEAATGLCGLGLVYSMARVYRLRTVPGWGGWLTPAAFLLAAGSVGGLAGALLLVLGAPDGEAGGVADFAAGAPLLLAGLCLAAELLLEPRWRAWRVAARELTDPGLFGGTAESAMGRSGRLRAALLATALVLSLAVWPVAAVAGQAELAGLLAGAFVAAAAAAVAGRLGFYLGYARRGV